MDAKRMIFIMLSCVALGMVAWYFGVHQPMEEKKRERMEQDRLERMLEKEATLLRQEGESLGSPENDANYLELKDKMDSVNVAADSLQALLDSFSKAHPKADSLMKAME